MTHGAAHAPSEICVSDYKSVCKCLVASGGNLRCLDCCCCCSRDNARQVIAQRQYKNRAFGLLTCRVACLYIYYTARYVPHVCRLKGWRTVRQMWRQSLILLKQMR